MAHKKIENKGLKIPEVSITIPIYNEEEGIEETILNLSKEFDKQKVDYELVLVNHGSVDNTHLVLEKLAKKNKRLNVINLPKNLGYGGGIMYGFLHSKGKYIGFTCADEEVSAQDVFKIFDYLRKNEYDISKGMRIQRKNGIFRKFTSFIFNSLISIRFNLGLKDINGYPIFMKNELFHLLKINEIGYLFNLDFLRKIKNIKYKIIEIPILHHERKRGKSCMKLLEIFKMGFDFLKYTLVSRS
jgi:glycosyltransferase involved in cell wall biosynthesis